MAGATSVQRSAVLFLTILGVLAGSGAAAQVVDYPHIRLNSEGLSAQECNDVPKLLIGGVKRCDEPSYREWLAEMRSWRDNHRIRFGSNDDLYRLPALHWTQSSYIQPQMMIEDRFFYDPVRHEYTVDKYVDDTIARYGGIDSVLIWHTYTNIGIDNRNQYDLLRDMPGGVAGVRSMIADFHRRGVKVFFPVMLWDQGTRDEGKPNAIATVELMKEIGADGVNGDTLDGFPLSFQTAAVQAHYPLAWEPEHFPASDEMLNWNTMSWGYWTYPYAPEVSRSKWLEPRSMVNVSSRWSRDKTDVIQAAFFNGVGVESWENVWGIWNGITPRDGETIRRVATIERATTNFLNSADWQPYYPTLRRSLFASYWPLGPDAMWTLVNRSDYEMTGEQMRVVHAPKQARYFDAYHGVELQPRIDGPDAILTFEVEPHGYGAILQLTSAPTADQKKFLNAMHVMTNKRLADLNADWHTLPQTLTPIKKTTPAESAPAGMVKLPAGSFHFVVNGIEIEGRDDVGVDVQYPWEPSPRRYHDHILNIDAFWMDKEPVTNAQFKQFIDATRYQPADSLNFLKDWTDGRYPRGWENRPVTWVSLEDARAYAAWAGKRLPHEWEWQYAAQGTDGRTYPWGDAWNAEAVPVPSHARDLERPAAVGTHPDGASPFGVLDMVGNVWQWTDEYTDTHTRAAVLRGGSYYQPSSSIWYFPQAYKNTEHGKLLLMAPSEDRAGTLGFRCVKDAP